jgi:hypothetical protein
MTGCRNVDWPDADAKVDVEVECGRRCAGRTGLVMADPAGVGLKFHEDARLCIDC